MNWKKLENLIVIIFDVFFPGIWEIEPNYMLKKVVNKQYRRFIRKYKYGKR